jgi:signal transduction histidine kinase/ligand-binding sensor domain-containing protein/DNA-binding response OmpR family regulator
MNRITHIFLIPIFLFLLSGEHSYSQWEHLRFESLTTDDGLPINQIFALCKDDKGFLWVGTTNGLVRYDGYTFKEYTNDPNNGRSISDNTITKIFRDSFGTIWIGTASGLNKFNPIDETFIHFFNFPNELFSIGGNLITEIYEDRENTLWIGTNGGGLNKFDRETEQFIRYKNIPQDSNSLNGNYVTAVCEDNDGNLWIGLYGNGVDKFNTTKHKFIHYSHSEKNLNSLSSNLVLSLFVDSQNVLWIGTEDNGLNKYRAANNSFTRFIKNPEDALSLNSRTVFSIAEDNNKNLLLGTGNGINIFNESRNRIDKYNFYRYDLTKILGFSREILVDKSGLIWVGTDANGMKKIDAKINFYHFKNFSGELFNSIMSICELSENKILVGRGGGGLVIFDLNSEESMIYKNDPNNPSSISSNIILSVHEDKSGVFWIGTYGGGLNRLVPDEKDLSLSTFISYKHNPNDLNSLSDNNVWDIFENSYGELWVGTSLGLNKVINRTDARNSLKFTHYKAIPNDSSSISNNIITTLYEDKNQNLWVGTFEGLNKYIRDKYLFVRYMQDKGKLNSLASNYIISIYEDKDSNLWVGTSAGLSKFNRYNGLCKNYFKKDGLPDEMIYRIEEDDNGNLWISTNNGLSKFNPLTEKFKNYDVRDGLQGNEFDAGASFKNKKGVLFFGGINGLTVFHPDSIKENTDVPQIVVTDFQLNNISVPVGLDTLTGRRILGSSIIETKQIELNHNDKVISFEFAALDFHMPSKNKYAYKLEGFDKDWNYTNASRRFVTYTNLDPGDYTFRVKGTNNDGYWNEEGASLKLIILPPWWQTTWAYLAYALIILSTIYFTWKLQLRRIRIKNEYEMSKFEAEKMHEVDELKSRFFANISHEFRTPLTLIFGPAKDVIEKTKESETKKSVGIIKRNATRLYGLVNQLLDLSKLESGKMKLEASEQDIIPMLKGTFLSFTSFAERKKITLKFNTIEENLNVYIDRDKVEKIINNLLSNAFKFTPEGGRIDFAVEKMIKDVEIRITDNGIGIPEERIDKIFDRFYQVDSSHTRQGEGTGIGLALTKELVELHKGKIKVESKEGEGTTVIVQLPLGKEHLKSEEIVEKEVQEVVTDTKEELEVVPEFENRKEKTDIDVLLDTDKPLLLVVEDNSDVRSYIISYLEDDYRIQEAVDGEDGLNQAIKHIPDLIVSDVMMPKMDGFELCDKLKTDERTSHIPIIMLTAKATSKDKIEGYETGADDYIMKPFDATELKVRIKNLIEIRRRLQKKFSRDDYAIPKELSSLDQRFMEKVLSIIKKHISEEEFSIDELGKESAMSRGQIYYKIKALTGKSPSLFLRSVRLMEAKKMIKEHKGTISEIAYSVGFGSPAYFTKCFSQEFGYPPSKLTNL